MFCPIVFKTTVSSVLFSALFAVLFAGCSLPHQEVSEHNHGHEESADDEHGHGHDHGEGMESVSLWTDELELFTEFPLLVPGEPQEFLLHLTLVKTGLPVQDVPVTFIAKSHDDGAEVSGTGEPVRSGIYTIAPVFAKGGEWSLGLEVPVGEGIATIIMDDLDVCDGEDKHEHEHGEEAAPANAIGFTKEQQWMVPVATVSAELGTIVERRKLPAFVPDTPDTRNVAATPVSGLTLAQNDTAFPKIGDVVAEGQVLARVTIETMTAESLAHNANLQGIQSLQLELTARAIEASGNAAQARALVGQYATALGRAEALLEAGAGSQREVDTLRGTLAEAQAALKAAEQAAAQAQQALKETQPESDAIQTGSVAVMAPISGRITRVFAGPGTRVAYGDPLFEIVNAAQVLIEARAPESLAATLALTPSGVFEIPGSPGELHEIVVPDNAPAPWILPEVDKDTRTVPILFHAANPDEALRVGMSLNLWLDINRVEGIVRIPNTAVVDEHGISTVYVMLEGETFQKRNIRLGITDGTYSEVLEGVRAGERVVSQGAYTVRLASLSGSSLGSAHVH